MFILAVTMVVLVILVFIGLVVFMQKMFNKEVTSATSHLDKLAAEYAQKEEAIRKQFEEAKRQSQEIIANAQKDAQQQKDALMKQAQEEKGKIITEAHQSAEEVIKQADNARLALLAELDQKINESAVLRASELLQTAIPDDIKSGIHQAWTGSIIGGSFENLNRLKIPEGLTEVSVVTAFTLSPDQRAQLSAKLKEKLGFEVKLAERVEPALIAGLIVTIGSLCFDGSLKFKIQEVARGRG